MGDFFLAIVRFCDVNHSLLVRVWSHWTLPSIKTTLRCAYRAYLLREADLVDQFGVAGVRAQGIELEICGQLV